MKGKSLCLVCLTLFLIASTISFAQENNSIGLKPLNVDLLAEESFLETEAGMTAYGQINPVNVDLDLAENAFKNIERRTSEYIVGSVDLLYYPESDDVHVYVDTSGWILAYYLSTELPSKIMDWEDYRNQQVIGTKLEDALTIVCAEMYLSLPPVYYYDFRYPNATNMMIITDEIPGTGTETFNVTVPSAGYFIYSRTWSHAIYNHNGNDDSNIQIDGELLNNRESTIAGWNLWEGEITALQLTPDISHEFSLYNGYGPQIDAYIGVFLIYRYTQP